MESIQQFVALIFIKKISLALCLYLRLNIMLENDLAMDIYMSQK